MEKKNIVKVYTTSSGAELNISAPSYKQTIEATNNRSQYFAEQAMKYRDEAKQYRDNTKYYAEQNSDVTYEYINNVKSSLESKINEDLKSYALKEELPVNVSELENDSLYVNETELAEAIDEVRLPSQEGCAGKVLVSDGESEKWVGMNAFQLFDTKLSDHLLEGEESIGWALQGSFVSKAIYPDFYAKCLEQKEAGVATETILSGSTITLYNNSNGHKFYDIADKGIVDTFYNAMGSAWFYGIDTENERIFLPRNDYFEQMTVDISEVGKYVEAGLPNITGYTSWQVNGIYSGSFGNATANNTNNGALYVSGSGKYGAVGVSGGDSATSGTQVNINASRSNSTYGNSDTVQPNAVKKLLYICVGNTTVNEALVDVGQLSSDLQYKTDKTEVDGQWVNYKYVIAQNVACPTSDITYDLSTVLPNDGYNYEIFIDVSGYTGTTNGNTSVISVTTDFYGSNGFNVVKNTTRYNANVQFSSCFNAVIGLGRTITFFKLSGNTGTFTCCLRAYRRIGTNL